MCVCVCVCVCVGGWVGGWVDCNLYKLCSFDVDETFLLEMYQ